MPLSPRRLERFLKIDRLIRSPQRQTATSLALELEVTERTIQGDITFLKDRYSAPIAFKKGRGLHYTDEGWRLPTVVLTQGELFALTLGARMLEVYAGTAYEEELQGAIALGPPELVEMVREEVMQMKILYEGVSHGSD